MFFLFVFRLGNAGLEIQRFSDVRVSDVRLP